MLTVKVAQRKGKIYKSVQIDRKSLLVHHRERKFTEKKYKSMKNYIQLLIIVIVNIILYTRSYQYIVDILQPSSPIVTRNKSLLINLITIIR